MDYGYGEKRLDDLARNILIGMELVDKRVDTLKGKKVKKELNEEEQLMAIKETNDFFADKGVQKRLESLKNLIVDNSYQDRFKKLYNGIESTLTQPNPNIINAKISYM